jgi:hypothetical protein
MEIQKIQDTDFCNDHSPERYDRLSYGHLHPLLGADEVTRWSRQLVNAICGDCDWFDTLCVALIMFMTALILVMLVLVSWN